MPHPRILLALAISGLGLLPVARTTALDRALSFDGATQYVSFGPTNTLGLATFTIEVWFKRTGTGATASTGSGGATAIPLVTKGHGEADGTNQDMNYFLGINAADNVLVADFEEGATGATPGLNHPVFGVTAISTGIWYHAAATYDGTKWQLYLDENLEAELTVGQPPRADSIQHAALATAQNSTGAASGYFAGVLDEVRLWNYARTAQQIADNISLEITNAPGLVARWGLNEGTGAVAADSSGSGITGTLVNSPGWVAGFSVTEPAKVIAEGDEWRYFKGTTFPAGWTTNGYNDSGWLAGPSGFGYGDGDDNTVLSDMQNNYVTVFTRKQFILTNVADITSMTLGADFDDGFVAYINGVEVVRRNVTGTVTNTLLAAGNHEASRGDSTPQPKEYIAITNNLATLLRPGSPSTNLIAVSAHNVSSGSSDLTLIIDLDVSSVITTNVTRGPYLQLGSWTNTTVRWRTSVPTDSRVRYGNHPTNLTVAVDNATVTAEHEVKLTGLTPDTKYYYSVGGTAETLAGGDATYYFVTAPLPGTRKPTRIWAHGDFGTADNSARAVRDIYLGFCGTNTAQLFLMLGDNAYNSGTDIEYQNAVYDTYPTILRNTMLWPSIGNHDTAQSGTPSQSLPYFQMFTLPRNAEAGGTPSGTENYYSFDYGNIHFVCLDSMTTTNRAAGGVMLNWLQLDLANTLQKWIIAYFHHPPYSKGSHNSDTETELIQMRQNALPVLEAGGVDLVLTGHSHNYERSYLIDGHYGTSTTFNASTMLKDGGSGRESGTGAYMKPNDTAHAGAVYTVAGSGGALASSWVGGSTAITNPTPHPVMFVSLRQLGSMIIDVNGDRLDARFITSTGITNDTFTILKGAGVNISPTIATAAEFGPVPGQFGVTRTGATNFAVTVNYTISGTASNGVDYSALPGSVSLPAGGTATNIIITPLSDTLAEGNETVNLALSPAVAYTISSGSNATVTIQDRPWDQWRLTWFGASANNPGVACDTCDPDGDSAVNLLECAVHADPTNSVAANFPALGVRTNGYLTLTYTRAIAATDLTFTVEASDEPAGGWSSAGIVEVELSNDGITRVIEARDAVPLTGATKRFMKLRVTRLP